MMRPGDAKELKRLLARLPDPLAAAAELCAAYRDLACELERRTRALRWRDDDDDSVETEHAEIAQLELLIGRWSR